MIASRILLATTLALTVSQWSCVDDSPPPPPPSAEPAAQTSQAADAPRGLARVNADASRRRSSQSSVALQPPKDPSSISFMGYSAPTDPVWRWAPPRNSMRLQNWTIPGHDGAEPAELMVTHFPEAAGNTKERNIDRWSKQFQNADLPVQPKVSSTRVAGMPVTLVEIQGEYLGMGGGWHKAHYAMLVAMVESPNGSIFIKLLGPEETVERHRAGWQAMVEGIRPEDS